MHTPSSCRCASAVGLAEHSNSLRIGQRPSLRSSFVPPPSAFAQYGQLSVDAFDAGPRVVSMHGTHSRQAALVTQLRPTAASPMCLQATLRRWPARARSEKQRSVAEKRMCSGVPQSIAAAPCKNSRSMWKTNVLWASARVKNFIVQFGLLVESTAAAGCRQLRHVLRQLRVVEDAQAVTGFRRAQLSKQRCMSSGTESPFQ